MFKKVISCIIAMVMVFSIVSVAIPKNVVYAAGTIWLEVTKDNAPVRTEKSDDGKVLRRLTKGTVITAEKKELNWKLRWWYKLKSGEYIHSGNVKETHEHKVVLAYYEKAHPHYAIHKCKHCDNGAMCGPETQKVKGCEKCYPSSIESKKENTNKVPNTNINTPADILVPTRPSLQEEAEKNTGGTICTHNYTLSHYESSHPHYAVYKCSCKDSYTDKGKTKKQSGCEKCFPHEHNYKRLGYNKSHPHAAIYECSCGNSYLESKETVLVKTCSECYPYGYGNDHFCNLVYTGENLKEHPHYAVDKCTICNKEKVNKNNTKKSSECNICGNPFKDKVENLPDFHGRIYDLSTGKIINVKEADALYDYAEERHASLDILGLIPVFGEVFDGINAVYYIIEGDYVNAALSGAAMLPFIGVLGTNGKIYAKTGRVVIDHTTGTAKLIAKEVTEEIVEISLKNISDVAEEIVDNYTKYSIVTLKNIKKISDNSDTLIDEVFYKGKVLISKNYKGYVKSPAGIIYKPGSYEGHRVLHVLQRHGSNLKGTPGHGTLFNVDGDELFQTIDDVYSSGNILEIVPRNDGKTDIYYQASKVIGMKGETKMKMIYEGDTFITAHPVKKVGD